MVFGFSLLCVGLVGIAASGIRANDVFVQDVLTNQTQALYLAAAAHEKSSHMHQRAFEVLVETDTIRWGELQKAFIAAADDLEKTLVEMKPVLDDTDFTLYDQLKPLTDRYRSAELKSYTFQTAGNRSAAEDQLQGETSDVFVKLDGIVQDLQSKQLRDMHTAGTDVQNLSQNTLVRMVVVGLIGLAFTIIGALLLVRWQITRPIGSMTEAMRRLASGDTTVAIPAVGQKDEIGAMAGAVQTFKDAAIEKLRLEAEAVEARRIATDERARNEAARAKAAEQQSAVVDGIATGLEKLADGDLVFRLQHRFADEYEKLRADFNGAMDKLQDTMKVVAANTAAIRSGSTEIATAADDLSKRTEQQAASLEETAAALDEITATVKKTSDGANHARQVVSTAKADAEHSGEVVGQAVQAMTAIEKSSQQVSQIIGVIDEIAFQTNLLALNAGVEAARAGEAGRGFAVVASEVRALAQRSAEAAKEIKALISTSTEQVGRGVSLVGETGKLLERIVSQVTEINANVSEIASSAQEQATGLDQVNTAVNQMDQVTQQNAAMVEQSTAASHSLSQEAEELARRIGQFQLGYEAEQRNTRRAPAKPPRAAHVALKTAGRGGAARKPETSVDEASWQEF
ncbi:HAMP domain-containing methyl-accepting chemotaxis protein [Lichenifustis flavocetrariae]|uniref:HAMP domain-containing methyl-accepting chemotaxis protein n=1 Tax=Lichenifustis flavocetrariae TaxID=2949735 RepID=UPI0024A66BD0|nr:methyl-accepting chemotaxis protein [Lichenifustis flavocetrariae]